MVIGMARLIDVDDLMKYINENHPYAGLPMAAHICTMELLTYAPTVDAVEVVRCVKCKSWDPVTGYCQFWHGFRPAGHYCGEGEKK